MVNWSELSATYRYKMIQIWSTMIQTCFWVASRYTDMPFESRPSTCGLECDKAGPRGLLFFFLGSCLWSHFWQPNLDPYPYSYDMAAICIYLGFVSEDFYAEQLVCWKHEPHSGNGFQEGWWAIWLPMRCSESSNKVNRSAEWPSTAAIYSIFNENLFFDPHFGSDITHSMEGDPSQCTDTL